MGRQTQSDFSTIAEYEGVIKKGAGRRQRCRDGKSLFYASSSNKLEMAKRKDWVNQTDTSLIWLGHPPFYDDKKYLPPSASMKC